MREIAAGAEPTTVQIVDVEDVPLAYLPGNATRVRVKAVGDLALRGQGSGAGHPLGGGQENGAGR